jgi:DNA-binding NarL/FixJ family response regulator
MVNITAYGIDLPPLMALKCVIVEDQTMFRQMLQNMVRSIPELAVVASVPTEAEGMAACREARPDLLLVDLALPDGNGINVAKCLVSLNSRARIIILSSEASTFVCPADLQKNVHAVLDKTQTFDELAGALRSLLPKVRVRPGPLKIGVIRDKLTEREYAIFLLIGWGLISKEIGDKLFISPQTVQTHRRNIAEKLGTTGPELVQLAIGHYHATTGAAALL